MIVSLFRLLIAVVAAFLVGKAVSKIKLPSILGWLITGMIVGPHALAIVNQSILDAVWYENVIHVLECSVGLMIGTELVWNKIKKSGKSIIITTITQSLGTFIVVSLVFGLVFYFTGMPVYLGVVFGGIALATAPAPALSIVREFKTDGPVTNTLIPMAALDDIVGCIVFFTSIAIIAGNLSAGNLPAYMIALFVLLPLIIGIVVGYFAGLILKKDRDEQKTLYILMAMILVASIVGFVFNNYVLPKPILNFMLIGMAFSATFANMISEERLESMMESFNPYLGVAMIFVILNLGAPLDYHLIVGAGIFTVIYILTRAFGKYFGAYFGSAITKAPTTVKKYLGFTLLPHSGVSLVFTGIAVSVLSGADPESAQIVQGTIAAAAVINEIIAVIMAKKGFEWAGEMNANALSPITEPVETLFPVITISRQHGSGGRQVGMQLAKELGIPCYNHEIIEMAAKTGNIDQSFFEHADTKGHDKFMYDLSDGMRINLSMNDKVFMETAKTIRELAQKGPCIIVGHCADYVLKDRQKVVNVFVYADLEERQHRIEKTYNETENIALDNIKKTDKKRVAYYEHYTNRTYGDFTNYDMCLNSSVIGIDNCVKIIKTMYEINKEK